VRRFSAAFDLLASKIIVVQPESAQSNTMPAQSNTMPDPAASWPHAPAHQLSENGTYFVTAGTYLKAHHRGLRRLDPKRRASARTPKRKRGIEPANWATPL